MVSMKYRWPSLPTSTLPSTALEERRKVVIGIAEIVEFDNFRTVGREIDFVFGASVEEITKLTTVFKPVALLLCPLFES
jgi:hypothetical protein